MKFGVIQTFDALHELKYFSSDVDELQKQDGMFQFKYGELKG